MALLMTEDPGVTDNKRLAYAERCVIAAEHYTGSPFRAALCKRIGDVYFDLDQVRFAGKWHAWYAKAAAAQPSYIQETPVGYRLQVYSKISLRKNLLAGAFSVYGFVVCVLALRAVRNRRAFDARYFIKRCAVFLGVFTALALVVFAIDLPLFSKSTGTFTEQKPLVAPAFSFVRPFIPLSVIDSSAPARAALVFLLGFLPIVLAVFYTSFTKPYSRLFLSAMILIFCASLWLHFLITAGSDELLTSKVAVTGSRVVFSGEPEDLLLKNPGKALRANPDLLKSGNDDLEEFIGKHYPAGFPAAK